LVPIPLIGRDQVATFQPIPFGQGVPVVIALVRPMPPVRGARDEKIDAVQRKLPNEIPSVAAQDSRIRLTFVNRRGSPDLAGTYGCGADSVRVRLTHCFRIQIPGKSRLRHCT
jgi:hypothetical protein